MKLFLLAIFFGSIFSINARMSHEKRREVLRKSMADCRAKENGSEDDLKRLLATQYPETHQGRCMIACSLEDFAIVSFGEFTVDVLRSNIEIISTQMENSARKLL